MQGLDPVRSPPEPGRPNPPGWVWGVARFAVRTFYRVERVGPALPDGALLLIANHPNALIDPAVIQATAGRAIRFLAKSTLFAGHPLSVLVRRSGAIPVYRSIDPGVDTTRNLEMFRAVATALAHGEAVCVFPEGISHDRGRLEPLRTGAARMVLTAETAAHRVSIVPVGLYFDRQPRFRSRVTAVFGAPFDVSDVVSSHNPSSAEAVRLVTDRMATRLRQLMVEADPREDLPLVARIDRVYAAARGVSQDPRDRIRRRRLIASGIDQLRRRDPARLLTLLDRVREYDAELRRFGLSDRDVDLRVTRRDAAWFVIREGLVALVLVPLAVGSLILFGVPYWITGRVGRSAPDLQSRATWQVVGGGIVYGVWIVLLAMGVAATMSVAHAAGAGVVLVGLAFTGLAAVEREAAAWRTVRAFTALQLTPPAARARLLRQRDRLATVLEQVQEWLSSPSSSRRD